MLVVLVLGVGLEGAMPDGERFPGQPFGFWMSPAPALSVPVCAREKARSSSGRERSGSTAWSGAEEGEDGQHPAVLVGRLG